MSDKKQMVVRWQRLLLAGETCPRCEATETEVEKAVATLIQALSPLGIEVILDKQALTVEEFRQDTLQSNTIWLNDRLLEDWLGAETGQSQCSDVCGSNACRTIEVQGAVYENITAELIVKAGLIAGSEMLGQNRNGSPTPAGGGCGSN